MERDLLASSSEDFWRWWGTLARKDNEVMGMSYVKGKNYPRDFRKRF